jgi:hypothetical protein
MIRSLRQLVNKHLYIIAVFIQIVYVRKNEIKDKVLDEYLDFRI